MKDNTSGNSDAALGIKSGLCLRDARPDDLDRVALLLRDAYQEYAKFLPPPVWERYLQDIMNVRGRRDVAELIVAELGGELAGTVTLYLKAADSPPGGWPGGWAGVRLLAVHPSCRGKGIGRALMDECIRRCRQRGIRTIGLHTTVMMEVARGLYERMGFGRAPEYDFHPRPEVAVMAYRLDL
jgi:ribosomal protein S18 acetylase RimI-like enzyme